MNKVLYIGPFLDSTGWAGAAVDYLRALKAGGFDVAARPIKLNASKESIPVDIQEMMETSAEGAAVVIQNVLPHMMRFDHNFKRNIGLCFFETDSLVGNSWAAHMNLMDEMIVPTTHNKQTCLNSNVKIPIHVVPCPTDISKYSGDYEVLPQLGEAFKFYTIGEFTRRKNLPALLRAFHTEFEPSENVDLIIKTTPVGMSNPQQEIGKVLQDIKVGLKFRGDASRYKQEKVICEFFSEEKMGRLHRTCDCFVSTSYSEGWSRSTIDAMGFGNVTLSPDSTAFRDYIVDGYNGFSIKTTEEDYFGTMDTFGDLQIPKHGCHPISIKDLRHNMRLVFENHKLKHELRENDINYWIGKDAAEDVRTKFSYEAIGAKLKELLCD